MPRVTTKTKSARGKVFNCTSCRQPITEGQRFYQWAKRYGGRQMRHVECGYPRPTELSNAKTAQIEEAVEDAGSQIDSWGIDVPEIVAGEEPETLDVDFSELESMLSDVASVARDVASEYEEGVEAMPEGLQQGSTGEAMRDVAERLSDWADEVEQWEPDTTTIDLPDPDDFEDDRDGYIEAVEAAIDEAVEQVRDEARTALEDIPTYEG